MKVIRRISMGLIAAAIIPLGILGVRWLDRSGQDPTVEVMTPPGRSEVASPVARAPAAAKTPRAEPSISPEAAHRQRILQRIDQAKALARRRTAQLQQLEEQSRELELAIDEAAALRKGVTARVKSQEEMMKLSSEELNTLAWADSLETAALQEYSEALREASETSSEDTHEAK